MKKLLVMIALAFTFLPVAQAEETVGDKVREAGREVRQGARKVKKKVWTRCADGRKTVKGKPGCDGHGGVALRQY